MRRVLRILAMTIALISILAWVAMGANRGWTRTSVPVKTLDEVTGIEGVQYRKQFVPGVELLAAGIVIAAVLAGLSSIFSNTNTRLNRK